MSRVTESRADELAVNRALWALVNERFTDAAAEDLWRRSDVVWGLFAVPERELGLLGDVRGRDVLELACGTAYLSAWLARAGARPVAVDLSGEQLATARRLRDRLGPDFPLVQGDVERVPLASGLLRPRRQRARRGRLVRPGAVAPRGLPAAAARRTPRVPHQQPPLSAVRPDRRGRRRGAAAARLPGGVPGAVAGRRRRVPPVARRLGAACCAGRGSSWSRCTRSSPRRTAPTTRSTTSSRRSGQPAGPRRRSGSRVASRAVVPARYRRSVDAPYAGPVELEFTGEVWHWRGPAPYHFVSVPEGDCGALEMAAPLVSYGWGMIPVDVRLGVDRVGDLALAEGRWATSSRSRTSCVEPRTWRSVMS